MERIHGRTVEKNTLMNQIIMMVWSLIQSQTFWTVKWALGSTNKASGYDGIPVERFKILKDNTIKMFH